MQKKFDSLAKEMFYFFLFGDIHKRQTQRINTHTLDAQSLQQ